MKAERASSNLHVSFPLFSVFPLSSHAPSNSALKLRVKQDSREASSAILTASLSFFFFFFDGA